MPIENLSYTHPIENLSFSYTHPNVPLLRRVFNAADSDSIKFCDREIALLLQFVQIYCARTSEPLTDSDKKFLAVCAKNVRGTPHSSPQLLLQLKLSAEQALVQPAIDLLRQAISLRDQALQQEQEAISLRDKAAQQEKQAISLRDQALQQEKQAPQQEKQAAQQEKQAAQQEQQAPQPPTMAELMQEQLRAMYEEEENMQHFPRSKIIRDPSQFSQTSQVNKVYGGSSSSNSR